MRRKAISTRFIHIYKKDLERYSRREIRRNQKKGSFQKVPFAILGVIIVFGFILRTKAGRGEELSFNKNRLLSSASLGLGALKTKEKTSVSQYDFVMPESPNLNVFQGNTLSPVSSVLVISPSSLGIFVSADDSEVKPKNEVVEYAVKEGDTLSSIAADFAVSLNTILWANDLTLKSTLKPGQKIMVLPVSGALHLVGQGDTIGAIARDYKAEAEEVISFNNLSDSGDIFVGDVLIIPGGIKPAPPKPADVLASPETAVANSYFISPTVGVISQGLHPYNAVDIANKCGTTPIYAAAGGTVQSRIGYASVSGNHIRILHPNNVVTFYGHLSKILVSPGQKVSQGQIIGYMGNTGYTVGLTGCHLHFEVRGSRNPLSGYALGSKIGPQ